MATKKIKAVPKKTAKAAKPKAVIKNKPAQEESAEQERLDYVRAGVMYKTNTQSLLDTMASQIKKL